jgi:PKD domain
MQPVRALQHRSTMKTRSAVGLAALVVGCHLDTLVKNPDGGGGGGGGGGGSGPVSALVFATGPGNARAGQLLPPVRVALVDSTGRTVATADSLVTVALDKNPSGAKLSGTPSVRAVNGAATFTDLWIDKADTGYTLSAHAGALPPAASPAFAVMPGPPTVLRFTVQPSSTMQNSAITPAVQVSAFDSLGNAATNYTGTIRVAKGTDGSVTKNAKLGGTTSVAAAAGVASFPDLTIDQPGTGYTLTAAVGSGPPVATSDAFTISPTPPPPPGSLTVTTTTTGADLDPNGYTVTVDGGTSQSIATTGSVTFNNLSPATHTVTLSDVASNCSVSGGTSRTVTVPSNGTGTAAFSVTCTATTGGITVTTTTTGSSLPSGYSVAVDGGAGQPIGINTSITITGLTPTSHAVVLSGVPANCTVTNGTSHNVTVTAGGTASTAFTITCTALPGDLTVSTNTTGQSIPSSGYTVTLDGTTNRAIGTTDNTTFTGLTAGSHTVVLSGVASNCTVTNGTSRTVTVPAGGSTTASFSVTCTALPGSITVSTTTTGSNFPSGYTVTLDGATSQPIGINDNVSFSNVAAGSHSVVLSGVPSNCTVTNGDTRSVTVPPGGTGSAAFTISCAAPTGSVAVSTTTTGSNLPSGYTVTLHGASQSIGINNTVTFTGVAVGSHTVTLSSVPANCTVTNGASQPVTVSAGSTAPVAFTVSCTAPPNNPPVVSVSGGTVVVAVGYSLSASFTDPDNDGPWSYSISWGDGSTDTGTATSQGAINGSHTYLVTGSYTIRVTVTDSHGGMGSGSATLTVIL